MKNKCGKKDKCIASMFLIETGNIAERTKLQQKKITAIVNAANPTLMGSKRGVDGNIHGEIEKLENKADFFKEMIREELDGDKKKPYNTIRCQRGQAVTTGGYGLCDHVIHVVGTEFDGKSREDSKQNYRSCSSSRVQILESCYYSIVEEIKSHGDIERIAVPIISSGSYGFPFYYAAQIAVASMGNALVEWKQKDPEMFELSGIKEIWFYLYKENSESEEAFMRRIEYMRRLIITYGLKFRKNRKVVFQSSFQSNFQVLQEVRKHDEMRGYFAVARSVRCFLTIIRILCMPWALIKDRLGGIDWKLRRQMVECTAFGKILLVMLMGLLVRQCADNVLWLLVFQAVVIYSMADTLTYLLSLMLMADVQRPSANIIRSFILLFVNYLEVSLDMAFLYFVNYRDQIASFQSALEFGVLGQQTKIQENFLIYANSGIKFFFLTVAVGYFASHIRQRQFRS